MEKERLEKERLEKERLEKERIEKQKMENKLFLNNSLFMIPSWGDLLGYPTLGMYAHHQVSRIVSDPVIFLTGYDYSIEIERGTLHYLFGLGSYFLKFELESGKYITDNRILTGLILSDFAYDHMATSANVTLEDDEDVIIAEKVIKVPIDLSYKSENHKTFIKGVLMRNIFIPHKDIFLEMMETIRNGDSYQIAKDGHKLLSTHWNFYNQILVSDKMKEKSDLSYLDSAAGLNGIVFAADQQLKEILSPENLTIIESKINSLKSIYSNLEFDPMYLFSILENASSMLSSDIARISPQQRKLTKKKSSKHSIFASAEDRSYAFASWPIQYKRKIKTEPMVPPEIAQHHTYLKQNSTQSPDVKIKVTPEYNQEKFELNTLKSDRVEFKPLPNPPAANIKQILLYLKKVIEEDYEMRSIGQSFEIARESMRQIGISSTSAQQTKIWEMSKYANIYLKKEPSFGLPAKEKQELIQKVDSWLFEIEEEERKERERLESIRLEKERREREEKERMGRESRERARKERERLEREKKERERLKQEMAERERLDKIKRKIQEEIRIEKERIERERVEIEAIEKEKLELDRLKQERKQKEKEAKQGAKRRKKLEKQKKKIEKKKQKEQERLENL
ncbi:hypothetical protein LCGC14_0658410 [marine sediment metagenome]|uniref:Uncharacterized protein n=1 Tax=marine sediment metagenome TaxID=412755 RepID=A0A0F9U2P3_9ZZZZ